MTERTAGPPGPRETKAWSVGTALTPEYSTIVRCAAHPFATSAIIKMIADAAFRRAGPPIFGAQPPEVSGRERARLRGGGRPARYARYASWNMPDQELWSTVELDANVVNNLFRFRSGRRGQAFV